MPRLPQLFTVGASPNASCRNSGRSRQACEAQRRWGENYPSILTMFRPNVALDGKDLDANYFSAQGPYLDDFNTQKAPSWLPWALCIMSLSAFYAGRTKDLQTAEKKALLSPCPTMPQMKAALSLLAMQDKGGLIKLDKMQA